MLRVTRAPRARPNFVHGYARCVPCTAVMLFGVAGMAAMIKGAGICYQTKDGTALFLQWHARQKKTGDASPRLLRSFIKSIRHASLA